MDTAVRYPGSMGYPPCQRTLASGMEHAIARRREQALMAEAAESCRTAFSPHDCTPRCGTFHGNS